MASTVNGIGRDALIERRQFALFVHGQSQQVNVGDLSMSDDRIRFEDFKNADVLGPEVTSQSVRKMARIAVTFPGQFAETPLIRGTP